jgi:choline dehydrogenase-like flavoprotein
MIEDAATASGGETLTTQLCIVGAGADGFTLALQFIGSGIDVLLLEGGGAGEESESQSLYRGEVVDATLHSAPDRYRRRQFGGSTTIWGGRCMPFDPIDFETRPWMAAQGWPIDYDEIARDYPAANALCEAGDYAYSARAALPGAMRPMIDAFAPSHFDADKIERFSCPTNFAARYGDRLAKAHNIRVLLHANCTQIVTRADGSAVEKLIVRTLSGKQCEIRAERFVLAVGGLEIPRLLLASRREAGGVGNRFDQVGRNYMCHIAGTMGQVRFADSRRNVFHGYERASDGVYCRRRLALRPDTQRDAEIGNGVVRLHHPDLPDPAHGRGILSAIYLAKPLISYEYSKRLHGGRAPSLRGVAHHVGNVAREPFAIAAFLAHWLRMHTLAARKFPSLIVVPRNNVYGLDVHVEQAPNPHSRVMLSAKCDALGMPTLNVDWRWRAIDMRTVEVMLGKLQQDIAAWGGGELTYDPSSVERAMLRDGAYGGHHIGTARMAANPEHGVVDSDCRVHDMRNLLIAGAAVFPTSSQANPTLTIVALALRMARLLRRELSPRAAFSL